MPNPGPATTITQEAVAAIGNYNKQGVFPLTLTTGALTASTITASTYVSTGIGLLVGDFVSVAYTSTQTAGCSITDAYVSAPDNLTIRWYASSAVSPATTAPYLVQVLRPLPLTSTVTTAPQLSW